MTSFYEFAYGNVDMTNESEVRDKILRFNSFSLVRCSNSDSYLRQKEVVDAFKQFLTRVVCDPDLLVSVLEDEKVIQHVTIDVPGYIATFEQINADHVRRLRAMQSPWEYLPSEQVISVDSSTLPCVGGMYRNNGSAPHETNMFCSFNGLHGYVASLHEFVKSMYVDEERIVQPVMDMLAALTQVNKQSFENAEARRASSYEIKMIRVQSARDDGLVLVGNLQMHAFTAGVVYGNNIE